jgi:hypothetical protein
MLISFEKEFKEQLVELAFATEYLLKNFQVDDIEFYPDQIIVLVTTELIYPQPGSLSLKDILQVEYALCHLSFDELVYQRAAIYGISTLGTTKEEINKRYYLYLSLKSNPTTVHYLRKSEEIRLQLNLIDGIWKCLPNELFILAFIPRTTAIPPELYTYISTYYQTQPNYELFEYFGDSVFEIIIREKLIMNYPMATPNELTRLANIIVRNTNLHCLMKTKELCTAIDTQSSDPKVCADSFEAILGILYYYLVYILEENNAIGIISTWLEEEWNIDQIIENAQLGITDCSDENLSYGEWDDITSCIDNNKYQVRDCLNPPCYNPLIRTLKCNTINECNMKFSKNLKPLSKLDLPTGFLDKYIIKRSPIRKGGVINIAIYDRLTKQQLACISTRNNSISIQSKVKEMLKSFV